MPVDPPTPRSAAPLVLGTAGHIDHGKTTLVGALTGTDTDRLPEERERGISIALGYARLDLPSGRALSLVDVPGHERFVRTMVSGATGIDLFLLTIAADDGVMPQTVEHLDVLRALGVRAGVVAITKRDLADPAPAAAQAAELLPGVPVVACSARTGEGLPELVAALEAVADGLPGRDFAGHAAPLGDRHGATTGGSGSAGSPGRARVQRSSPGARDDATPPARDGATPPARDGATPPARDDATSGCDAEGPPVLHVDRVFTVAGRGTVVTGTLWSGRLRTGETLELSPGARSARVRGLEVHGEPCEEAGPGRRVAVALGGVRRRDVERGDVLSAPGARTEHDVLDCALVLRDPRHGEHVHVHHGTREAPARLSHLTEDLFQLRLQRPLMAVDGDRVVVRRSSPAVTLGGGVVLDASARRHGRRADLLDRLRRRRDGLPEPEPDVAPDAGSAAPEPDEEPRPRSAAAAALEERLLAGGLAFPGEAALDAGEALVELLEAGRAVRLPGRLVGHADVVADARARIVALTAAHGSTSLAEVRDALGISRKPAQALLEHTDALRLTLRRPDDRRVLSRRAAAGSTA
jgi:selenocysteine-specific elongation factor